MEFFTGLHPGRVRRGRRRNRAHALEETQGQNDSFFSQHPHQCYLEEVVSAGDRLKICPWVASRVGYQMEMVRLVNYSGFAEGL